MVLAGGFGTRLRSLITDVPKSLAPVAGRPFLIHLIEKWVAQGAKDFIDIGIPEDYLEFCNWIQRD